MSIGGWLRTGELLYPVNGEIIRVDFIKKVVFTELGILRMSEFLLGSSTLIV
jgi:hypothetical protein